MTRPRSGSESSIHKALRLLLALSEEGTELGPTELSHKLGIHKATVSRILLQLRDQDFVYRNDDNGKFWLGVAANHLGESFSLAFFRKIVPIAKPHVDSVRDDLKFTIALEVWSGNSTAGAYIAKSEPKQDVSVPRGVILPLNAAAGAQAILAFMDPSRVDQLLDGKLEKETPNTIIDKDTLIERLGEFREQGYAVDQEEVFFGISAIAVPVFDRLKAPVAALVVLVPSEAFGAISVPKYASRLSAAARSIEKEVSLRM
jgi:DNA-binding IclR family transcriptional regulator